MERIKVKVELFGWLKEATGEEQILAETATEAKAALLDIIGIIKEKNQSTIENADICFLINGKQPSVYMKSKIPLKNDDIISAIPIIGGG